MKRMYVLVADWMDIGHVVNSCVHAGAMIDSRWDKSDPAMADWYANSFRKITCKVTAIEFEKAKTYADWFAVTESAFENKEVVLVFKPRDEYPKFFSFLKLYK